MDRFSHPLRGRGVYCHLQRSEGSHHPGETGQEAMNKLKTTIWIGVLANSVIAFAGLNLSIVFSFIFDSTIVGGVDAMAELSKLYIRREQWYFTVFTVPLLILALILSARRTISLEGTLLFGAIVLLNISLQIFFAAVALGQPFIPVHVHSQRKAVSESTLLIGPTAEAARSPHPG